MARATERALARIFGALAATLFLALSAWANPCALPEGGLPFTSGMGGTGIDSGTGMGGTGLGGDGMGGTGISSGTGMGGTGLRAQGGMGGTGIDSGTGLGGTGLRAKDGIGGSGMGGTGRRADGSGIGGTGVVGIITGFGSICVNGLEIHYDAGTPVTMDGRSASAGQLVIGRLVSVDAVGGGASLRARHIELNSAVVGPVDWSAPGGHAFMVLGQTVHPASGVRAPQAGEFVRVDGFRSPDGSLLATHVGRLPAARTVSVTGVVEASSGRTVRIGGLTAVGVDHVATGTPVRLTGRLAAGGVLETQRTELAPEMRYAARAERMVLQGIVNEVDAKGMSIGYARIGGAAGRDVEVGQWVRVEVERRPDGRLDVRQLLVDSPRASGRDAGSRPGNRDRREHDGGRDGREEHGEKAGSEGHGSVERLDKGGDSEKIRDAVRVEKHERVERPEKADVPETIEKPDKVEKYDD